MNVFPLEMLRGANLEDMTSKKVRKQLELAFSTSFEDRKKEITQMIESIINAESSDSDSDSEKPEINSAPKKSVKKEKKKNDSSSGEDDEELARKLQQEEELKGKRATRSRGNAKANSSSKSKKKRKKNDSDSDDEPKKKRNNGYLKAHLLSDELAHFMGEKEVIFGRSCMIVLRALPQG